MPTWDSYKERIASAATSDALAAVEHELFGRKAGLLTVALKELGALAPDARKAKAVELNDAKKTLSEAIEERRRSLGQPSDADLAQKDAIDITMELPRHEAGHLHLIPEFIRKVEEIFGRMGFEIAEGPEIETDDYNFTLLNIPPNHPARDAQDTFWLQGQDKLLRTHTSAIQCRYMRTHKPPFRIIYYGKCYRKDADATHSPMFHQFEAMVIGKNINLSHMKSVMVQAMRELTDKNAEFRFRASYFPFVEPGMEVDMRWQGDESESREGKWLEVAGCGLVHPNVLKNGGIDPEEWRGFAFAFGIERMIMIKHRIPDLRSFYHGDLRFLRQF